MSPLRGGSTIRLKGKPSMESERGGRGRPPHTRYRAGDGPDDSYSAALLFRESVEER